ncbi:hypothetical protein [Candidatus Cyanaurora vandensis]|uniref:hypothetical protein n=1 Tax=Candidatus Cyanaurora vandensis TaxID=2714958 RepID=UPI002579558F|nr:hypothetical protein [Candidatus Cyanaurora vandensis]
MTTDELLQLIAANTIATAENTKSITDLRGAVSDLRGAVSDLRAVVSDVREIQAEQSREFNDLVQVMRLSLVRMEQLYTQNADLQQRVSILENE